MTSTKPIKLDVPFPALTPAQRLHLDILGYVIVPDVLSRDECGTILDALKRIRADLRIERERGPHEPFTLINQPFHTFMGGIIEADPCLTAFVSHPRLVGMAEELLGGEARITEYNAHINSRIPGATFDDAPKFGFHNGVDIPFGTYYKNSFLYSNFVKTLTMLTDLGEDDGGTVVIAGSHKLELDQNEMIEAAYTDRSLIHQVIAPAGSTLLFTEALIHATGQIRSDNERGIIIGGYGPSMYPYWDGTEIRKEFLEAVPPQFKTLFCGKAHWTRAERFRENLGQPVDPREFTLKDGYWPTTPA